MRPRASFRSLERALELSRRFELEPEPAALAVREFLAQLLDEALVVENANASSDTFAAADSLTADAAAPTRAGARAPFEAPRLVKYSDLQDLLVLDPIHDVVLAGWPSGTH